MSQESTRSPAAARHRGPTAQVVELKDMVVAYARQETVDPLKTLGRYLGYGVGGALLIGTGWIFALLGLLRLLQEFDVFNQPGELDGGRWGWVPYVITFVVGAVIVALYARVVSKRFNDDLTDQSTNSTDSPQGASR